VGVEPEFDSALMNSPSIRSRFTMLLLAVHLLSGCTVGPNYRKPVVPIPDAYHGPADQGAGEIQQPESQTPSYADLPWWEVFHDPVLQDLIGQTLAHNYDLRLATERINAARAQLMVTRADQFPQVTAEATGTDGRFFQGGFGSRSKSATYAADATFQLDLWGKMRRATEAARAQLLGTEYAQKTAILTLVSDTASDYFALLALDLQLHITRETIATQQDAVALTKLRMDRGVGTKLDVLQAQQVLDTANAQIPELEREIGQLEDAISILVGDYPRAVARGRPLVEQPLPPEIPAGLPSALLARRPDISQAEQNLITANAEIGVAKAALFPQIALTGSGGGAAGQATLLSTMINSTVGIWSYGLNIAQPLFDGGRLRGNVRLAESQQRQHLIAYQQAIQGAFRDVSDALIGHDKYHSVREKQEVTVKDLQESVDTSLTRYRGGIATYLEVLDGQRSLFNAELTLAQARGNEYQSVIQLYKALGGGWQQ
jgi:outer membrane protein, multidrug efflux system